MNETTTSGRNLMGKLWPWLLLAILTLAILYFLQGYAQQTEKDAISGVSDNTTVITNATSMVVPDIKEGYRSIHLPSGTSIQIEEGSATEQLVEYLLGTQPESDGRYIFDQIQFESGSAQLVSESQEVIRNLAIIMNAFQTATMQIEGHTDNSGTATSNLRLSQLRADAVKETITQLEVAAERIEAIGLGQSQPRLSNETEAGKHANERVEIIISKR